MTPKPERFYMLYRELVFKFTGTTLPLWKDIDNTYQRMWTEMFNRTEELRGQGEL